MADIELYCLRLGSCVVACCDILGVLSQVAIMPENGEDVIRRATDVLGYPLDTVIQLSIPEGSQSSLAPPFTSELPVPLAWSLPLMASIVPQVLHTKRSGRNRLLPA